jgi:hypothetical protein
LTPAKDHKFGSSLIHVTTIAKVENWFQKTRACPCFKTSQEQAYHGTLWLFSNALSFERSWSITLWWIGAHPTRLDLHLVNQATPWRLTKLSLWMWSGKCKEGGPRILEVHCKASIFRNFAT